MKNIALSARNAEYNPKRFAAVIMRIREPRTTALIFSSGKMVCTGAKSEEQARLAARKYARIIQRLGFEVILSLYDLLYAVSFLLSVYIYLSGTTNHHIQDVPYKICNFQIELGGLHRRIIPEPLT